MVFFGHWSHHGRRKGELIILIPNRGDINVMEGNEGAAMAEFLTQITFLK